MPYSTSPVGHLVYVLVVWWAVADGCQFVQTPTKATAQHGVTGNAPLDGVGRGEDKIKEKLKEKNTYVRKS